MKSRFVVSGQEYYLNRAIVTEAEILGQYKVKVIFKSVEIETTIKGAVPSTTIVGMAQDYDVAKAFKTATRSAKKSMKHARSI